MFAFNQLHIFSPGRLTTQSLGHLTAATNAHRKKACEERERDRKNRENYDLMPDVSPSYYRVGDPSTGEHAKMVSGVQERSGSQGSQEFRSNSQDSQGIASGSAGVSAAP